jgi:BirA family biotin operon repressor/biotin-[acetyl-CoA-carboxylase] ligase
MALWMAVFMFSMAGIPPLRGFFAKLYVLPCRRSAGLTGRSPVVGVATSVVSAYYYLRIVKVMYFDEGVGALGCAADKPVGCDGGHRLLHAAVLRLPGPGHLGGRGGGRLPRRVTAAALPPGWRLRIHEALPSTSDLLLQLAAAGESEGLAVMARRQSAGRGRDGRVWESPAGNLYISVLLRPGGPAREAPQWALLAAVALAEALSGFVPDPSALRLKWPNDLLLGGAKCAGVLAEASATPEGRTEWLVLGMGANLVVAPAAGGHSARHHPPRRTWRPRCSRRPVLAPTGCGGLRPIRAAWLSQRTGPDASHRRPRPATISQVASRALPRRRPVVSTGGRVHAVWGRSRGSAMLLAVDAGNTNVVFAFMMGRMARPLAHPDGARAAHSDDTRLAARAAAAWVLKPPTSPLRIGTVCRRRFTTCGVSAATGSHPSR